MRKVICVAALVAALSFSIPSSFAKAPAAAKSGPGAIVIVFKDGHRQSFPLSDIARVEFAGAEDAGGAAGAVSSLAPTREHFFGKWEVGDGTGDKFYITLDSNGEAWRSLGNVGGKWVYVNGEARVTWNDGAMDAIRKIGAEHQKFAYKAGKLFTDTPDNVTGARNTTPHPI